MSNFCPFLIPQGIGSFIPRSHQLPPLSIASFVILFRATPFRSCHLIMSNTHPRDIEAEFSAAQPDHPLIMSNTPTPFVSSVVNTVSDHNNPSVVNLTVAHTASVVNSSSPVLINPKKSTVSAEKPSSAPETFGLTSDNLDIHSATTPSTENKKQPLLSSPPPSRKRKVAKYKDEDIQHYVATIKQMNADNADKKSFRL